MFFGDDYPNAPKTPEKQAFSHQRKKFDGVERPFAPGIKDAYCDDANRHMIEGTIPWTRLPQSDWI
ncbi:pantothenate synthetase [Roseibium sp. TrichSKD4]|nr:pantothenate synthetase [Roseibium sp. TrichSKD4]